MDDPVAGIAVDELAVAGVDNFEMICELAIPPLSGVSSRPIPARRILELLWEPREK
jgi:hypothetical protein